MSEMAAERLESPQETPTKYYKKTLQAIQMVQAGIAAEDALKMVNLKDTISAKQVSVLRAKVKKFSLTEPSMVSLAQKQVKRILKGNTRILNQQKVLSNGDVVDYKEQIAPSDTNIIAAASMVYDRFEPAVQVHEHTGTITHAVDLSQYSNGEVLDIDPSTQVCEITDGKDDNV